jgi:GNAT superfamily N-acetyltransferase
MAKYIGGEDSIGPFWAIILQDKPIGITGWFRADYLPKSSVGLRWTGIHPEYRGHGGFRAAVQHVISDVRAAAPEIEMITELAPALWAHQIVPAFQKLGFEVVKERHQTQGTDPLFEGAYVLNYHLDRIP